MYGLEAIEAANGWGVTVAGLSIVFTGLVVLAGVMSKMQTLLTLWDRRTALIQALQFKTQPQETELSESDGEKPRPVLTEVATVQLSHEQVEVANSFHMITNRLGDPFSLPRLVEKAVLHGISHPYRHLETFLKLNLIVESRGDEPGLYEWRKDVRIVNEEDQIS